TLIFTTASVVGILIFFMIALQCTSTVGILKREMGSWKPALLQLFLSNLVAYGLAVTVVSILKSFGY
ncbi:MAG: ferrous iron transporter B, partial [Bdellovibrionota bacterium]